MVSPRSTIRLALSDIKLAHTLFAMPFAILAGIMALPSDITRARATGLLALIILCMVFARTWAMLINRIADAHLDARNPRTAQRAIASGRLHRRSAKWIAGGCALLFVASTLGFLALRGNPWPALLSVPVLAWIAFYSFTKRFTALAHFFLGGALAASPIAAAIAIQPSCVGLGLHLGASLAAPTDTGAAILWLALFVLLWVAGFDIAYALQDIDFDRAAGLHSIPAVLGPRGALWTARAVHGAALGALSAGVLTEPRFGAVAISALGLVAVVLLIEHVVLAARGVAGLPLAFFTLNGLISLLLGAAGIIDVFL